MTLFAIMLISYCFGQEISIVNSNTLKEIQKSDILEITLGEFDAKRKRQRDCCNFTELIGSIESISADSVIINTTNLRIRSSLGDTSKELIYDWEDESRRKSILKNDILYLTRYKSSQGKKVKTILSFAGGVLIVGGAITTLNALLISKNDNRKNHLAVGGLEMGLGVVLGMASAKKRHYFKTMDPWSFSK